MYVSSVGPHSSSGVLSDRARILDWPGHTGPVPGPAPRSLLRDTLPAEHGEALRVVNRDDVDLALLASHSNLQVEWRCSQCGHRWQATPASRSRGGGCPDCAWQRRARSRAQAPSGRSLADLFPRVAAEFLVNLDRPEMAPSDLRAASKQRCLWRCSDCSAEWEATVANRTKGTGCLACANRRRAERCRTPTSESGTAAQYARFPHTEMLQNLTNPDLGLDDLKPNSVDRCLWRCSVCRREWEATVVNRVGRGSGCPDCSVRRAGEMRATAPIEASLLALHPTIAAEFVENLSAPRRTPAQTWPGSNTMSRWRCGRGHEWTTTPASRVAGTGCARCGGRGQSRLEFEVAEMLRMVTHEHVELDWPVRLGARTWRLDIAVPGIDLLIDLDPERWHGDQARDQRKVDALAGHRYVRLRPESLPPLTGATMATVTDDCSDAYEWVSALREICTSLGLRWDELTLDQRGLALAAAATRWRETLSGRPKRSALDVAPHLAREFLKNLTRPGVTPASLSPSTRDLCRWRCTKCSHVWTTSLGSRAGAGTNCPACARAETATQSRVRSRPEPGASLADTRPQIAAEFVRCLAQPERTPTDLRPSSNLRCVWHCGECGNEYEAVVGTRTSGRGCPRCAVVRRGNVRSTVTFTDSLAFRFPNLAVELIDVLDRPGRSARDLAPGSNYRARWRCSVCTHEWETTIASRALNGAGCRACAHRQVARVRATPAAGQSLLDRHPDIAAQFRQNLSHPGRGPHQISVASHDRCRFECGEGHEWISVVKNRTRQGSGCPHCYAASRRRGR